jgi:hypothetical protein
MRRAFWQCWLAVLLASRVGWAQSPTEEHAAGRAQVRAQAHLGVATSPFYVPAFPRARGQTLVMQVGAGVAFSQQLHLDLRAALVLGSVAQPAGSYLDTRAFGNPELVGAYTWRVGRVFDAPLTLSAGLGIAAPLASHRSDYMPDRMLAVADGLFGRGHPEWFTPGVLPLTPQVRLVAAWPVWRASAELRLPLLVRTSDVGLPSSTTRDLGLAGVLEGQVSARLSEVLSLAATVHLLVDAVPPVRPVRAVSPLQDFERLSLTVHVSPSAVLFVDLQTAIGGALGGSMVGGGFGARVGF